MPSPAKGKKTEATVPSFAEALASAVIRPGYNGLKVDQVLDELEEAERHDVIVALLDPLLPHRTIARAITALGHPISPGAVSTWRSEPTKRKAR